MKYGTFVVLVGCAFLCSCSKSPSSATDGQERILKETTEARVQEEAAKIAAERERLAELQQDAREKVAADLAARTEVREAARAANLERAAAEQARRDGIISELTIFIDVLQIEVMRSDRGEVLRMNGQWAWPGTVIVSPSGYSVTYTKHEGDYFWFDHDEDAFTLTVKKPSAGYSYPEVTTKQPLADGFKIGQTLPQVPAGSFSTGGATSSRGLVMLKTMGTWKLNESKSALIQGNAKADIQVFEPAGDKVKVTMDGTDENGKSFHNEWVGNFDGKDYVTSAARYSRSYKRIDDHTLEVTTKMDGKVTFHNRHVISADGKTRTVTPWTGTGKAVYDKI